MTRRHVSAGVVGLAALAIAFGLLLRESGPLATPGSRVAVPDATPAILDTIAVAGRTVEASLDGTVVQVGPRRVWLAVGDGAVPLRFRQPHGLAVEDRVLAVGRLRARGGRRWVQVSAWAVVSASVRPPSDAGAQPFTGPVRPFADPAPS